MTAFFTSLPFVGLFLKFMVASTVLMGSIWLLERLRILRLPDIRELAWKLAIAASFLALLPVSNWLSGPITIHHDETKSLVSRFDSGQPISAFMHRTPRRIKRSANGCRRARSLLKATSPWRAPSPAPQ